jgi:glycerophosphoryl diester phosphodiesterase
MWKDLAVPVVIAHRGDSAHGPENTLAAFQMAADKGAEAIEFDVKLTRDDQVIVLHDQSVDRTTDGQGDIRNHSLAALRELDAGVRFDMRFTGERIPTLDEVFETFGKSLHLNVELTNYMTPGDTLVPKVIETVIRHNVNERVLLSSFYARNLKKAKALLPGISCGLLAWPGWMGVPARTWTWRQQFYSALHPHLSSVDATLVKRLHSAGKRLQVWTVNAEEDMVRLIGFGVDGIFTDDPALLGRCLGRKN